MVTPPANIVGGNSVPLGRPVVPDVYNRLGNGVMSSGSSVDALPANHWCQSVTPSIPSQYHPTTVSTPAWRAAAIPRSAVSGPTNTICVCESPRM